MSAKQGGVALRNALRNTGLGAAVQRPFALAPELHVACTNLAGFLMHFPGAHRPLIEECLIEAMTWLKKEQQAGGADSAGAFLYGLLHHTHRVMRYEAVAKVDDVESHRWDPMVQPLSDFLAERNQPTLEFRPIQSQIERSACAAMIAVRVLPIDSAYAVFHAYARAHSEAMARADQHANEERNDAAEKTPAHS